MIPKNGMTTFALSNELLRKKRYAEAIDAYRTLLRERRFSIYRENLIRALLGYHKMISTSGSNTCGVVKRASLCFITSGIKGPTPGGGIATCFLNMVEAVAKNGSADVTVVYMAHPYYARGNFESWSEHFLNSYGVRLLVLDKNNRNYGSEGMNRSFTISEYLASTDGLYDTVVFHDFMGLGYYSLLLKQYGLALQSTRITISAHGNHELSYFFGSKKIVKWTERATMFMERSSIKLADIVTTPSQYYANWLREHYGAKHCICMPNIIHASKDTIIDSTQMGDDKKLNLYFFGRMERLKGIDVFIEAIKILKSDFEEINVVFSGNVSQIDGMDAREYITAKLSETACSLKYFVDISPSDFFKFVRGQGGLVVFPTLGETSSCVVVESILHNAPFVASDIPGIVELIDSRYHDDVLFETGNASALADKIRTRITRSVCPQLSFDMKDNERCWVDFLCDNQSTYKREDVLINQPLVSIVVPTCNRPELLETTLDALIAQTYSRIEIIVIDDNSTDWRLNKQICHSKGIEYIHLAASRFKGAACNEAVRYTNGEYICFFDDDDLAYPEMIESYVRTFNRIPELDVLSCFADCFEHANLDSNSVSPIEYVSLSLGGTLETNILANFFGKGTFIIKSDKFHMVGGYQVDETTIPMVDYRFYIRAALKGLNISIIPKSLYRYRKNSPNSLFYENKDNKQLMFLAKNKIEAEFISRYGYGVGKTVSQVVWNLSLPAYE